MTFRKDSAKPLILQDRTSYRVDIRRRHNEVTFDLCVEIVKLNAGDRRMNGHSLMFSPVTMSITLPWCRNAQLHRLVNIIRTPTLAPLVPEGPYLLRGLGVECSIEPFPPRWYLRQWCVHLVPVLFMLLGLRFLSSNNLPKCLQRPQCSCQSPPHPATRCMVFPLRMLFAHLSMDRSNLAQTSMITR